MSLSNTMFTIKYCLVWLTRLHLCRGFGIQSPWAYSFVRYVVNEHYPYYAYADMRAKHTIMNKKIEKMGKLLFRLANFVQPTTSYLDREILTNQPLLSEYILRGCNNTTILPLPSNTQTLHTKEPLLFVIGNDNTPLHTLTTCKKQSVAVILDIYSNKKQAQMWHTLKNNHNASVSFDLYYCGIVFLNKDIYKQHYKINF